LNVRYHLNNRSTGKKVERACRKLILLINFGQHPDSDVLEGTKGEARKEKKQRRRPRMGLPSEIYYLNAYWKYFSWADRGN